MRRRRRLFAVRPNESRSRPCDGHRAALKRTLEAIATAEDAGLVEMDMGINEAGNRKTPAGIGIGAVPIADISN